MDETELCNKMRWVYDNRAEAKKIADKGMEDVHENYTWKQTAAKIHRRLLEINSEGI